MRWLALLLVCPLACTRAQAQHSFGDDDDDDTFEPTRAPFVECSGLESLRTTPQPVIYPDAVGQPVFDSLSNAAVPVSSGGWVVHAPDGARLGMLPFNAAPLPRARGFAQADTQTLQLLTPDGSFDGSFALGTRTVAAAAAGQGFVLLGASGSTPQLLFLDDAGRPRGDEVSAAGLAGATNLRVLLDGQGTALVVGATAAGDVAQWANPKGTLGAAFAVPRPTCSGSPGPAAARFLPLSGGGFATWHDAPASGTCSAPLPGYVFALVPGAAPSPAPAWLGEAALPGLAWVRARSTLASIATSAPTGSCTRFARRLAADGTVCATAELSAPQDCAFGGDVLTEDGSLVQSGTLGVRVWPQLLR